MKQYGLFASLLAFMALSGKGWCDTVPDTIALKGVEVTVIKRTGLTADLAASVTDVSGREADRLGIVSLRGLSDVVPNFYIPDYGSRVTSSIYVRGIGARMDQPAVGLTIDNVPVMDKDAFDLDIEDIAHMEMLRGPQSTLYGRNAMGGLINITTLSPLTYRGVRLRAEYGSANSRRVAAGWFNPVSESAGVSLALNYTGTDGFFRNLYNNVKTGRENQWGGRANFTLRNEHVTLRNVLALSNLNQSGYPYEYVETGEVSYNDTCFYRRFLLTDGLTIGWRSGEVGFTSMTSVQYLDNNLTLDQDFLPEPYFTLTQKKREIAVTQDLVTKGSKSKWQWISGVFLFGRHIDMSAPVTFGDVGIAELIEAHRNASNSDYPIEWQSRNFCLNSDFRMPGLGAAVYHQSAVTLGRWRLEAGLRIDYEYAALRYKNYCNTGYDIYHLTSEGNREWWRSVPIDLDEKGKLHREFVEFLPRLSAVMEYGPDAASSLYASIAKGYKAGGYNTQMFSDVLQQKLMGVMGIGAAYDVDKVVGYRPEKSWNFEIGTHMSLLQERVHVDASVFYIYCRDQQLTMFPDGTTTGRIMTNAGRTRSFGGEISVAWRPSSSFTARTSYGYTNARFVRFSNGQADYHGKYLPYAPSNTLFGEISYLPHRRMEITAYVNCAGKIYWNEANSLEQPFYAQLGASVRVRIIDGMDIRFWGENLTDARFHTFYFMSMGHEFVQRGRPRRVGVTWQYCIDTTR